MTAALQHVYSPRNSCSELFNRRDGEVLLSGPAGTGKSRACLEKLNLMCLLTPRVRGLIVRKTRESLGSTALVTWREHVVQEAIDNRTVWYYGGSGEEPAQYRYSNGSVVVVGGMDKPSKIMSSEYDVAYVQEATELTVEDWEALTTRLRNNRISFQQLMADCNPNADTHWLYKRCKEGKTALLESRHEDNPVYFTEGGTLTDLGREYIQKLDNLTGVRYLRLRKGLWVGAEGLIYDEFDPSFHVIDKFKVPDSWTRYWTVDFGMVNPFVCQHWAEDEDGRLFMYREFYMTGKLVEDHARDILKEVTDENGQWTEPQPAAIICDHDAEDRATLERHLGLRTTAAKKTVSDGLQAVSSRMKKQMDGKARIYLFKNSLVQRDQKLFQAGKPCCTEEEIPRYVWADHASKEQPVKEDDHGCDCKRYLVAHKDLKPRFNIRSFGG